jgi:hypothetical protein
LRLDAVIEERERIAMDAPREKTKALMEMGILTKFTKQIDNMNESLERLKADTSTGQRD